MSSARISEVIALVRVLAQEVVFWRNNNRPDLMFLRKARIQRILSESNQDDSDKLLAMLEKDFKFTADFFGETALAKETEEETDVMQALQRAGLLW